MAMDDSQDEKQKESPENKVTHSHTGLTHWEKITGFIFGLIFVSVLLAITLFIAEPTPSQYATFKTILALAAAGIGGILAGTLHVEGSLQKWSVRAGGAIALFALVYFFSPAPPNATQEQSDVKQTIDDGGTGAIHTGEGDINIGR
jgi:hypothetical protein